MAKPGVGLNFLNVVRVFCQIDSIEPSCGVGDFGFFACCPISFSLQPRILFQRQPVVKLSLTSISRYAMERDLFNATEKNGLPRMRIWNSVRQSGEFINMAHSYLRAMLGSTRAARRAGTQQARNPVIRSTTGTHVKVHGS